MYEDSVQWQQWASSEQLFGQNISVPKIQGFDIWATYNYDDDALHRVVEYYSLTGSIGYGGGCDDHECWHNTQLVFFCSGQEQTQGQLLATSSSAANKATEQS